jgi:hypothetical protein
MEEMCGQLHIRTKGFNHTKQRKYSRHGLLKRGFSCSMTRESGDSGVTNRKGDFASKHKLDPRCREPFAVV